MDAAGRRLTGAARQLRDRVARFVADSGADDFDALAHDVFRLQYDHLAPFRRLCATRGTTPDAITDWRDVPAVPTAAFRRHALALLPAAEIFRSSGTTGGAEARSVHHQPFPGLYRAILDASFPRFALAGLPARPPMLVLVPPRAVAPDSSLGFMADHVAHRFGGDDVVWAYGNDGFDRAAADAWGARRADDRRPGLIFATALALATWIESLDGDDARMPLPAGTAVLETGGFKGQRRAWTPADLRAGLRRRLGVPADRVVREYGMTELTSQLYTETLMRADATADADTLARLDARFVAPHWLRARVLDPATLREMPTGAAGLLAFYDLGNVGAVSPILTQDQGVRDADGGLRLLGRAPGAMLRGCSLTAEALDAPRRA